MVVLHDDMPPYVAHGWKCIVTDKTSSMYLPFGPPFNIGIPSTSVSQSSRVDPKTGPLKIMALGVRNRVGVVAMTEAALGRHHGVWPVPDGLRVVPVIPRVLAALLALALCGAALPDGPAPDYPEAFWQSRGGCWRRWWKPMAACRCTWTARQ